MSLEGGVDVVARGMSRALAQQVKFLEKKGKIEKSPQFVRDLVARGNCP